MSIAIPLGMSCIIDNGITAPVAGSVFSFQPKAGGGDFSATFQATGTVTTLSGDLQISLDGGTTWSGAGTAFITAAAPNKTQVVICGALYRLNYTTASGSSVIRVCSN